MKGKKIKRWLQTFLTADTIKTYRIMKRKNKEKIRSEIVTN